MLSLLGGGAKVSPHISLFMLPLFFLSSALSRKKAKAYSLPLLSLEDREPKRENRRERVTRESQKGFLRERILERDMWKDMWRDRWRNIRRETRWVRLFFWGRKIERDFLYRENWRKRRVEKYIQRAERVKRMLLLFWNKKARASPFFFFDLLLRRSKTEEAKGCFAFLEATGCFCFFGTKNHFDPPPLPVFSFFKEKKRGEGRVRLFFEGENGKRSKKQ